MVLKVYILYTIYTTYYIQYFITQEDELFLFILPNCTFSELVLTLFTRDEHNTHRCFPIEMQYHLDMEDFCLLTNENIPSLDCRRLFQCGNLWYMCVRMCVFMCVYHGLRARARVLLFVE